MMPQYYQQRATAGLIITEATQISDSSQGYFLSSLARCPRFTPDIPKRRITNGTLCTRAC